MMTDKQRALIERLHARTASGQLGWSETPKRGVFAATFPGYAIQVSQEEGHNPEEVDVRFTIINSQGDVVESILDNDVGGEISDIKSKQKFFRMCAEVYSMARRSAFGVDQALDSILKSLE